MGHLTMDVEPSTNPEQYGLKVSVFTILPCALSLPFFLVAGWKMKQLKQEKKAEAA